MRNNIIKLCIEKPDALVKEGINYVQESMEAYEEEGKRKEGKEERGHADDGTKSTEQERMKDKAVWLQAAMQKKVKN